MSELAKLRDIISELEKTYPQGGVTSVGSFAEQVGEPSAEVMLTEGKKKKKFITDRVVDETTDLKKVHDAPKVKTSGIVTSSNGKKIPVTGLSGKEYNEYIFGKPDPRQPKVPNPLKKCLDVSDTMLELLSTYTAPDIEDNFTEVLEKCDAKASKLIKAKDGVWRRIGGRPCFICKDGDIHAGPSSFVGKKAATLRDDLRAERKKAKK